MVHKSVDKTNYVLRREALLSRIIDGINSFEDLIVTDKFTIREKYKLKLAYLYLALILGLFVNFTFFDYQFIISILTGILSTILCVGAVFHYLNSKYNYAQFDFLNKKIVYRSRFFDKEKELVVNQDSDIKFNIEQIGSGSPRFFNMQLRINNQLILDSGSEYESNCEDLKKVLLKFFREFYEIK
ncbi:hypothetical protein ERX46_03855 [Brumimicrobium glaciale]|uniref:Uncharacterized protein n=1 Tax=Brumimicrobium glaciale TaxID=200475 RepID=A0A4Q4KR93_9FLAO|nr:hypothetical protein [Brumimicrobium glaciale]RYM34519.1 hypothetical protein ERX46_03855 [Brumimicrobium glaciale]